MSLGNDMFCSNETKDFCLILESNDEIKTVWVHKIVLRLSSKWFDKLLVRPKYQFMFKWRVSNMDIAERLIKYFYMRDIRIFDQCPKKDLLYFVALLDMHNLFYGIIPYIQTDYESSSAALSSSSVSSSSSLSCSSSCSSASKTSASKMGSSSTSSSSLSSSSSSLSEG